MSFDGVEGEVQKKENEDYADQPKKTQQKNKNSKENLPLIYNPTINQQIRNLMLFKTNEGVPFSKVVKGQYTVPASTSAARKQIESNVYDLKDTLFEKHKLVQKEHVSKQKKA